MQIASTVRVSLQDSDGCLLQSDTPDKTQVDTAKSEHEKFTPQKPSPASSISRTSSSAKRLGRFQSPKSTPGKRVPSSAAKRLRYVLSPGAVNGNSNMSCDFKSPTSEMHERLQPMTQASTIAVQRSPLRSPHRAVNGTSDSGDTDVSHELSRSSTSEVNHRSPEVNNKLTGFSRSPKVTNKSPKVVIRSPEVANMPAEIDKSPRQRQPVIDSCLKRYRLESPAGQPKTKKFIVERLRNAKTSRKKIIDVAAGNKSSPSRHKSPHQKCTGKCVFIIMTLIIVCS